LSDYIQVKLGVVNIVALVVTVGRPITRTTAIVLFDSKRVLEEAAIASAWHRAEHIHGVHPPTKPEVRLCLQHRPNVNGGLSSETCDPQVHTSRKHTYTQYWDDLCKSRGVNIDLKRRRLW
jgi:hypothetical protein